jgi:FkbM family methyltransferase
MKLVYNYWMPNSDNHFERLIAKRIKKGGPPEYQDDVRDVAYRYVDDFSLAIDVGANVGLWAKPLTRKFDRVIAFEPLEQVYTCLERNVNGLPVDINRFALGSVNSTVEMVYDAENTGGSFVSEVGTGSIQIKRLDDLNLPKFGLLKIDCERHELEVLKGAMNTILKYKPIIVCEQQADTNECAGMFLKSYGAYEITNVRKDYIFGWR